MPIILAILFWLLYESIGAFLSNAKWKSDHKLPANNMEYMLGWYELYGSDWMFHAANLVPKEILEESWYKMKEKNHPDKDHKWCEQIFPYKTGKSFVLPNRIVWDEYWKNESGEENYAELFPWLKYPDNRDDWGTLNEGEHSSWDKGNVPLTWKQTLKEYNKSHATN